MNSCCIFATAMLLITSIIVVSGQGEHAFPLPGPVVSSSPDDDKFEMAVSILTCLSTRQLPVFVFLCCFLFSWIHPVMRMLTWEVTVWAVTTQLQLKQLSWSWLFFRSCFLRKTKQHINLFSPSSCQTAIPSKRSPSWGSVWKYCASRVETSWPRTSDHRIQVNSNPSLRSRQDWSSKDGSLHSWLIPSSIVWLDSWSFLWDSITLQNQESHK